MCERGVDIIMMVGPMKKKVVTTGIVCAIIPIVVLGVLGFFMFKKYGEKISDLEVQSEVVQRYVLKEDVMANHVLTASDFELRGVKKLSDPNDSYTNKTSKDEELREIREARINEDEKTAQKIALLNHFRNPNGVTTDDKNLIIGRRMKLNARANTILTESMFYEEDKVPTVDLRLQEFNMIALPSDLVENDYIDVRVRFPSGEDYSVLIGKRVESYSNNTIFIKLTEDEILTIGSAIIEAYILDGTKLYANKYVDAANQLFEYKNVDYVAKYNVAVEELLAAKNSEVAVTEPVVQNTEITEEGEEAVVQPTVEKKEEVKFTVDDLAIEDIANRIGLEVDEAKMLQNAIKQNREDVLKDYRNKVVASEKKIARTYPVKDNVLSLIKSNPNILEEVKANFDTQALLAQRLVMADTTLNELAPDYEDTVGKITNKLATEIQTQREERVAYLKSLLSK